MKHNRRRLVPPLVAAAAMLLAPLPIAAGVVAGGLDQETGATQSGRDIETSSTNADTQTWRNLAQPVPNGGESLAVLVDPELAAEPVSEPSVTAQSTPAASLAATPSPIAPEVIKRSESGRPEVAITLDADLSSWTLDKIRQGSMPAQVNATALDYLEQTNTASTVFVTGLWAQEYPEVMSRMAANPLYELANHSWGHDAWTSDCYGLPVLAGDPIANVTDTSRVIAAHTGKWPEFFRFPGLCHDPADVAVVASQGARTVDYDLDGSDAFAANPSAVASSLAAQARAGSIIVLHLNGAPNAAHTTEILTLLVPALEAKGLTPVTMSQLMAQ